MTWCCRVVNASSLSTLRLVVGAWNGLPVQQFQADDRGHRVHSGWIGNWVCNTCGRTFDQHDNRITMLRANHSCALQGGCRLCLDSQNDSYTWMCGASGCLPDPDPVTDQFGDVPSWQSNCGVGNGGGGYFACLPPLTNDETTNSFLYCPILLNAGGLLQEEVAQAWANGIPWFGGASDLLRGRTCDLCFLAQAYDEL